MVSLISLSYSMAVFSANSFGLFQIMSYYYHSHSCDLFFFLEKYGPWDQNIWQYPEILEVRYPKVGEVNPINSLWLTDLKNGAMEKKQILPPQSLQGSEVHFAQVTWADQGTKFAVTWFNRIQNESVITLCDVNALDCSGEEIFRRVNILNTF